MQINVLHAINRQVDRIQLEYICVIIKVLHHSVRRTYAELNTMMKSVLYLKMNC